MKELRFHGKVIVTGSGSIQHLKNVDMQRAFIVTGGNSVFANGSYAAIQSILEQKGCAVCLFSGIPKNPPVETVIEGIAKMREFRPDTVIGLGGGSAIDAAKAMALFYDHPELDIIDSFKKGIFPQTRTTQLIAIPGTSGTATEVTPFSVLTFRDLDIKIGGKAVGLIADIAILDADLTLSMPKNVVAETGMDAMTHAVECYIHPGLDDFTQVLAAGAIEGLFNYLPESYATGSLAAREKVHNYQSIAGCAFSNVGTGMDHGIAHAFGGKFDYAHGLLIAIALPYVLQFNSRDPVVKEKLAYLSRRVGKDFIQGIKELNKELNIPRAFKDLGLSRVEFAANFDLLVKNSLKGATRFNPIPVSTEDMQYILTCLYEGKDIE
ncbi:alcohol dehydrogenase [Anaerosporomusa subterranea]|uniref:Alcohol dehydrogenase n=1 Tax=Anaerosporomusa subterranea TaxID=1794912 RepID=A0A154BRQ8_ANASB|nr:iron-containing alcohol dehydrogenase [Anaerosporomusa subterranea]KYZ76208.1 alcohol dehydrogenase [Anaerosporomusa subterranea]